MNCLESQELLHKRLDGDASAGTEALERHLSECPACRDLHASAGRLLEGLRRLPALHPPAGLARDLAAQVIHDRIKRRQKMRRRVLVTMALAASVLLILLTAYQWLPRSQPNPQHAPPELAKKAPAFKELPPLTKQADDARPRGAFTALTERWADTTRDHAQVVLVGTSLDAVEKLPDELPMIDPGVREAGQEVSDGVRTVTRNARKAFDFFARELPMPDIGEQRN